MTWTQLLQSHSDEAKFAGLLIANSQLKRFPEQQVHILQCLCECHGLSKFLGRLLRAKDQNYSSVAISVLQALIHAKEPTKCVQYDLIHDLMQFIRSQQSRDDHDNSMTISTLNIIEWACQHKVVPDEEILLFAYEMIQLYQSCDIFEISLQLTAMAFGSPDNTNSWWKVRRKILSSICRQVCVHELFDARVNAVKLLLGTLNEYLDQNTSIDEELNWCLNCRQILSSLLSNRLDDESRYVCFELSALCIEYLGPIWLTLSTNCDGELCESFVKVLLNNVFVDIEIGLERLMLEKKDSIEEETEVSYYQENIIGAIYLSILFISRLTECEISDDCHDFCLHRLSSETLLIVQQRLDEILKSLTMFWKSLEYDTRRLHPECERAVLAMVEFLQLWQQIEASSLEIEDALESCGTFLASLRD